jgi:hypothetical protein
MRRVLALALAGIAAVAPAQAAPVGQFAVEGIVLGASLDFVLDRFPTMFLEEMEYEDPDAGLRYKAYLPSTAQRFIEQTVGRIQVTRGDRLLTLRASFVGSRELFELVAIEERASVNCAAEIAAAVDRWGEPEYRDKDTLAQWIEIELDVYRRLDLQCFPGSGVQYLLFDEGLLARHRARLRAAVAPYVEQALIQGGG